MSASYADQDNGTVLYVGKDRKKADLKQWFEALPRSCLEAIESISMDMWPAFINATLEMVPGAESKIAFDKFHVAKYLGEAVDKVRREEHRKLMKAGKADLKGTKRVFDLVKDFGTSESPKSTRSSTTHWCPGRPGHPAFRHNIASSLRLHTGLPYDWTPRSDAPLGSPLAPSARRVSRVASRLPGTTRLRFALHGGQRKYDWLSNPKNMTRRQKQRFKALRDSTLKTARAWAIKELAMSLWGYVSKTWARKGWARWLSWAVRCRLEPMKKVAKTIKKHLWGILNAIVLKVSNGPAEGINSRIKAIKVRSHGFRNKERFANAIYFHLGGLDLYPEAISQQLLPT